MRNLSGSDGPESWSKKFSPEARYRSGSGMATSDRSVGTGYGTLFFCRILSIVRCDDLYDGNNAVVSCEAWFSHRLRICLGGSNVDTALSRMQARISKASFSAGSSG